MSLTKSLTLRPAADARHGAGGQRVVGAGDVVAHGLRGPAADEDRACIADPVEVAGGVYCEVFRRDAVGDELRFFFA